MLSTSYSRCLNNPLIYVMKLRRFRNDFASQDPSDLDMFLQPVDKYFADVSTHISQTLESLPILLRDFTSCVNYLNIWNDHYVRCKEEINHQEHKKLQLVYSLSDVFFALLILCQQEQINENSLTNATNNSKGNDIKARMYKKFEIINNINRRSMLKKWTACWRLHHFLWVTNINSIEMIEAKLNLKYFTNATEDEYTFLIRVLLENPEFSGFVNPKGDKILELVEIGKKVYKL